MKPLRLFPILFAALAMSGPAQAASPSDPTIEAAHAFLAEIGSRGTSQLEINAIVEWRGQACQSSISARNGTYAGATTALEIDWSRVTSAELGDGREIKLSGALRRSGKPSALAFFYMESREIAARTVKAMEFLRTSCEPQGQPF